MVFLYLTEREKGSFVSRDSKGTYCTLLFFAQLEKNIKAPPKKIQRKENLIFGDVLFL